MFKKLERRYKLIKVETGNGIETKKYAEIVFEENNPEVIADIILKTIQYGEEKVKKHLILSP